VFKGRRVWRRVARSPLPVALVVATLASGWAWASGARLDALG
jgi:hypothetical protein